MKREGSTSSVNTWYCVRSYNRSLRSVDFINRSNKWLPCEPKTHGAMVQKIFVSEKGLRTSLFNTVQTAPAAANG